MRRTAAALLLAGGLVIIAPTVASAASFSDVVPVPVTSQPSAEVSFTIGSGTGIYTDSTAVGNYLAGILRPSTGFALPVASGAGTGIELRLGGPDPAEGYTLDVTGSYVEFTVNRTSAGPATVVLRYANGTTTNRQLNVNGTVLDLPGTGAWTTWTTRTLSLNLNAGANTIRATATTANGGPNLDYLELQ